MADDIDLAQHEIDWAQRITVQAVINQVDHLEGLGLCHHCEEPLDVYGQLFCDLNCARDYERVTWAQRMSNK